MTIEEAGVADRVTAAAGDFFADPLPAADLAGWLRDAGFAEPTITNLGQGFSVAVAQRTG